MPEYVCASCLPAFHVIHAAPRVRRSVSQTRGYSLATKATVMPRRASTEKEKPGFFGFMKDLVKAPPTKADLVIVARGSVQSHL